MALITCPECGHQVSDLAPHCPHCGAPIAASTQTIFEPVSPQPAASSYGEGGGQPRTPQPRRRSHTVLLVVLGVVVALVAALFAFCPDEEAHRQEVHKLSEKAVKMVASEQGALVSIVANFTGGALADVVVDNLLEVDNYGVCSVGRICHPTDPTKSTYVSFGIAGKVFTASPETVLDKVREGLDKKKREVTDKIEEDIREGVNEAIEEAKEGVRVEMENVKEDLKEDLSSRIDEFLSGESRHSRDDADEDDD